MSLPSDNGGKAAVRPQCLSVHLSDSLFIRPSVLPDRSFYHDIS